MAFSALGLLISSRAKTMEAASGLMNLVMLPMWILSGVFFSASRFPAVIQPFVRALPLDGGERGFARKYAAGRGVESPGGAGGDSVGVAGGAVCCGAQDFPVEIDAAGSLSIEQIAN